MSWETWNWFVRQPQRESEVSSVTPENNSSMGLSSVHLLQETQEWTFDPRAEKTPQRRKRKPTPGFLPSEPQRHSGPVGDSPWGRESQTQFINWAHTHTQGEWAAFTKEGDLMVFTKHGVCGVQPGAAALQLRPRKQRRGCWCNAGAELPKALHTSSSSDSFQSNGHWLAPTDGEKGASWVPNRSCNWTGQETRQNV